MHFEVFNPTEERKSIALITLSSHFIGGGAGSSITAYRHRDAAGAGPARVAAGGGGRGGRQLKGEIYTDILLLQIGHFIARPLLEKLSKYTNSLTYMRSAGVAALMAARGK